MIRRYRGAEPDELRQERVWRVARRILYPEPPTTGDVATRAAPYDDSYNLPGVRQRLRIAQRGRCAYCGSGPVEAAHYDIEHFRPRTRYWWLTWTWENLWLACKVCQSKSNDFELDANAVPPLRPGPLPAPSVVDATRAFALSSESSMLLDPAKDEPQHHLCFEEVPGTGGGWDWMGQSLRGRHTVTRLKLNRETRTAAYDQLKEHLRRWVIPQMTAVIATTGEARQQAWQKCRDDFLWQSDSSPTEADYLVPTWWFLKKKFEVHGLAQHGLEMWPYPDDARDQPLPADPPALDHGFLLPSALPAEARLHVLYIQGAGTVPWQHLHPAIVAVCRHQPQTKESLAALLNRSPETLKTPLKALSDAGLLRREPYTRPYVYSAP